MKRLYNTEKYFRRFRVTAIIVGVALHSLVVIGLFFYNSNEPASTAAQPDEINFGSSGGGGEENANKHDPVEFGEHLPTQEDPRNYIKDATVELINIHIEQPQPIVENAVPVIEREKPKVTAVRKSKPRKSIIAENLPIGHVRHGGQGPGSGGGMGGGSGGGIGARQGYSIDWGGIGGRRLLSGRIPKYPPGTDKEMAVVLRFSVLPDGSVDQILPARKSDELLERAAISALQTWRFDPLPTQVNQKPQGGRVTFNFKLERDKERNEL